MKIKTASDLKYLYKSRNPEGHFFDRDTMRFFGDSMRNFGIAHAGPGASEYDEKGEYLGKGRFRRILSVVELRRKRPVKHGLSESHYFDEATGQQISNFVPWDDAKHCAK